MMTVDEMLEKKFGASKRFVDVRDAAFILELRLNERLARFLSPTGTDVKAQEQWIERYKLREKNNDEFYFVLCDTATGCQYGVSRIYNLDKKSFEIGSWLFSPHTPEGLAILADLSTRDYAFEKFGFEYCRFEVRKANKNVVGYHKRFQPELVDEDKLNYYFKLDRVQYVHYRNQLLKFYGNGIK